MPDILREITAMYSTEQLLEMRQEYQKSIAAIDDILDARVMDTVTSETLQTGVPLAEMKPRG